MAALLTSSQDAIQKTDALEAKFHNPAADVVYDILAMRGGAKLYSRLAPLQMWSIESEGPPTTGMTQVLAAQEKELSDLEAEARALMEGDIASVNAQAAKLGLAFVILP